MIEAVHDYCPQSRIEALQGSLVNLNIKLDRMLAQQQDKAKRESPARETPRPKPKPRPAAKPHAPEASSA